MSAWRVGAALLMGLCLGPPSAAASPLLAAEVLAAVDARIPKLAAARWSIEEKEAKLLASRGSFDPTLSAKATVEDQDPYAWTVTDEALSLALPLGPQLTVGHRMGVGKIPDYYGEYATADRGELRVAATLPLLQDLGMSPERAARLLAETEAEGARAKARQVEVEIAAKAALSWAKWVASGEKLRLADALVALADNRQHGLQRQVEEGALARIHLLDNERALAEWRGDQARARQDLEVAALSLSLWFRDADFQPLRPSPERLPPPVEALPAPLGALDPALTQAATRHPDLAAADALLLAAQVEVKRARSLLLPQLDLRGELARDLSAGASLPVEQMAGVDLKLPLFMRKGRGSLTAAEAALARIGEERRGIADSLSAEVAQAWSAADGARARWEQAAAAAARAQEVAELERRAFELGASDLFRVVKREEAVAKSQKDLIDARLAWRAAVVASALATGERVSADRL